MPSRTFKPPVFALAAGVAFTAGCSAGPPRVNGVAGAPPSPSTPWQAPAGAVKAEARIENAKTAAIPPDIEERIKQLTLVDVVDLALRNNPATRASWAQARASADLFGAARGAYYPTVNGSANLSRAKSANTNVRTGGISNQYGPSISLNYLLLD